MKRRRIVLGLLMTVAAVAVVSILIAMPVLGATPAFTGNVESDFQDTDPSIVVVADPSDVPLFVPGHPVPNTHSGWDIKDLRLTYDPASDTLYVGLNSYATIGDVDSDGNEGPPATYGGGIDSANLGGTETVFVYFDFDEDGNWDAIVGDPDNVDFSGFTMKTAVQDPTPGNPPAFGAIDRSSHLNLSGGVLWKPDLEFVIEDFSLIPEQDGDLGSFRVGAYMGAQLDGVGEDSMVGSVDLPTPPPPVGGTAFPVSKLGLIAPWVVLVACVGVVTAFMLRRRRQA